MSAQKLNIFWRENWGIVLTAVIYAGVFVFDIIMPLGFIDWIFYFPPILLNVPMKPRQVLWLPTAASALIIAGLFLSPPGIPIYFAIFNRSTGIIMLWLSAIMRKRRMLSEESLRQSEARFRAMFEENKAVMLLIDPSDGIIADANNAASRYYGYPCERLRRMRISEINMLPGEEVVAEYTKAAEEKRAYFVFPHRLADGRVRWVEVYSSPIVLEGKKLLFSVIHDVTERKKAQEALAESENRYRAFFQLAGAAAVEIDPDSGRFIRVNQAFSRMTGYSPEELGRLSYVDLTYPADRERDKSNFPRLIRGEISEYNFEKRYVRKGGQLFWIRVSATLVRGQNGKPLRVVGIGVDIDEIRKSHEALSRERHLLQTIFDTVPVMFTLYDPQLQGMQINSYLQKVTGWSVEDAQSKDFLEKVYPDPQYRKDVEEYMHSLAPGFRDLVMTGKDGSRIITSWANVALPGGRQVGIGLDIRERKRAEEALRRAEEHLRLAIEASDEGTWDYDIVSGTFILGAHSRKILGLSDNDEITPEKFLNMVHPDDRARVEEAIQKALSPDSDGLYKVEFCVLRPDGNVRWLDARGQVYFQEEGGRRVAVRFIGVNRDVTENKRVEEILRRDKNTFERMVQERSHRLLEAQRELDRSRRLSDIGKLAATIAHELRNPLTAIDLAGASIRRKARDPAVERSSENIRKKVGESNRIIDDILYFTRMRPPAFEDVAVFDLLSEAMKTAKARHPDPRFLVDADFGPLRGVTIRADADHLREVFANLLNNAFEAIPQNRRGNINVNARAKDDMVEVSVRDNGSGIPEEARDKLFEPFFTTKKTGTGLGLAVVSQIIKMHKGTITVDSRPGEGTTMTVRLPLKPEAGV